MQGILASSWEWRPLQTAEDQNFMEMALSLAREPISRTSPNPRVGAVVVREGDVVGRGCHRGPGQPHAETEALREAGDLARGATLYVTLEPCCHQGHTPPCTAALIAAGVTRVVTSIEDPNPVVSGRGIRELQQAGLQVDVGVLREEAEALNAGYLRWRLSGRPHVTAKWAQALCGHAASRSGQSRYLTGPEALREVHRLRAEVDAVMVGVGTVLADDPELTVRHVSGQNPLRIVLDTKLRTPPDARLLHSPGETIIFCGESAGADRVQALSRRAAIVRLPSQNGLPVALVLSELGRREITSVLVEGGPSLLGSLFDQHLVDRVAAFFAPLVLGGESAPAGVLGIGVDSPAAALRFSDGRWQQYGDDICFTGTVVGSVN